MTINGFNSLVQDLGLAPKLPEGSEPYQYKNKYGDTSYYLYGPQSDTADRLTEKEMMDIIRAKEQHKRIFNQQIQGELFEAVDKRTHKKEELPAGKGYFEYFYGYVSPSSWREWWNSGKDKLPVEPAPKPTPAPTPKPVTPVTPSPPTAQVDPATVLTNPLILDVYYQMETVVRNHGPHLQTAIGLLSTCEITMNNGKVVPITIDARPGRGQIYIGKAETKPDMTMKMSEATFVKLFQNKLSPQTALMFGQVKLDGSLSNA
jgi:hypothetical protein